MGDNSNLMNIKNEEKEKCNEASKMWGLEEFADLQHKIREIQNLIKDKNLPLQEELASLEKALQDMEGEFYQDLNPWERVKIARHPARPVASDYIQALFTDFTELHGDRYFQDDAAIIGGIARFAGMPVTVIGQQKGRTTKENIRRNFAMASPEGYRKSLRLMKQAEKFNRPVITLIDTPGAYPGLGAEERGQAEAIARNLREMSRLSVPVIAIVIGEGGSGGALGLGVANRVLMLENGIYSVISPEGLASILWKDAGRAQEAANIMRLTARDLLDLEIIEEIIPEPPGGAHKNPQEVFEALRKTLDKELAKLIEQSPQEIRNSRYEKFRKIGS